MALLLILSPFDLNPSIFYPKSRFHLEERSRGGIFLLAFLPAGLSFFDS